MNKETQITTFSLSDLGKMVGVDPRECEYLIAHSESALEALHYPCRIDALIIGVGTEGEATVSSNHQEYTLRKNTLFFHTPNIIIQPPRYERFKAHVMGITTEFTQRLHIDTTRMMPLFIHFATTSCIQLTEEEGQSLRRLITQLETEIDHPASPFTQEVVSGLISIIIYKAGNILYRHRTENSEEKLPTKKRAESYFAAFMQLLSEHYKTERSVGFYAKQLCITPKYLTTLIRRISDKSVSEWIDNCVILEAKTLLVYSGMSIQEIAYSLNFPNQSFFGSYFKRNTGLSPTQYKAQQ